MAAGLLSIVGVNGQPVHASGVAGRGGNRVIREIHPLSRHAACDVHCWSRRTTPERQVVLEMDLPSSSR
jgi:hypothetical protein